MRTFTAWICRCTDGTYWADQPRHMTCAECHSLIREVELVTVQDALNYSPESIKAASRGY